MRNLASMRIGAHLMCVRGRYWVTFGGDETKTGQPYEAPFPDALLPPLDRYLNHDRPVLLMGENHSTPAVLDALWISEVGTQLEQGAFGRRIVIHTRKTFGQSLPPHWCRDAAATEIAIHNPAFVDDARHLLGHTTPRTAERHYNQARSLVASRRHHALLAQWREDAGRTDKADGDDR
jgi:integrase/recombinase XerD